MADYLWKKLSENEKEQIKEDAKKLILEFGNTIDSLKDMKEVVVQRDSDRRDEGSVESCGSEEFRKLSFENALKKDGDFFVAEKGSWT